MINTPYKNQRKEAISAISIPQATTQDSHSKHRLSSPTQASSASSLYTQSLWGQNLCLLTPVLIILAIIISSSCSGGEESKSSQIEVIEPTVTEIPKRASTDVRDSYVLFSISAKEAVPDYLLAVKERSAAAPTPAEITLAGLKRNLDSTPINVLIAQRLNAPMITFAKNYFSDNTQQTLGADMLKRFYPSHNLGLIYDGNAAETEAWIKESILKSSTEYTLYGMKEGGSQIEVLQTFATDAALVVPTTGPELDYADSTLAKDHIEIAVNVNELYIFPLQVQMNITQGMSAVFLLFSENISAASEILVGNVGEAGSIFAPDLGHTNMLYLFKDMGSHVETYANGGIYVLMNTADRQVRFDYGLSYRTLTGGADTPIKKYSVLIKQQ